MNQAAILVSDAILGQSCTTIIINNKSYLLKAPTIEIVARLSQPLARMELKEVLTIEDVETQCHHLAEALAIAWLGNKKDWEIELPVAVEQIKQATLEELKEAFEKLVTLIIPKDFFVCATLGMEVAMLIAKPASKATTH